MKDDLIEFATEQQRRFDSSTSPDERKERGHFGTPPVIARFMVSMFHSRPEGDIRILDPGAGVGTLSAAVCQQAIEQNTRQQYSFELWENDLTLVAILEETMRRCRKSMRAAGHDMKFVIRVDDFILANTRESLFRSDDENKFDLAILNPPYFKLRKDSPQARAMEHVVHGQPNIYALFMAVAADRLAPNGEMIAITPRSYFSGPYFRRFRQWFLDRMTARRIHLFESRTDAFKDDAVLQENVILHAEKGGKTNDVLLTHSFGRDLSNLEESTVGYSSVIGNSSGDHVIRITTNHFDKEILSTMDSLPSRFRSHDFEISTGPIVSFRSLKLLRHDRGDDTAPLFWMHNVRPFVTRFVPKSRKPSHIEVSEASRKLLVHANWYVLLKRFTAKEEKRRLVAGILRPSDSYSEWVGLENHLNYVYRRGSDLSRHEAFGLAAFFNSALVDRYFRAISGNTQVNAAEIRAMPLPDKETLVRIGEEVERLDVNDFTVVEEVVGRVLKLPRRLAQQLVEVAR